MKISFCWNTRRSREHGNENATVRRLDAAAAGQSFSSTVNRTPDGRSTRESKRESEIHACGRPVIVATSSSDRRGRGQSRRAIHGTRASETARPRGSERGSEREWLTDGRREGFVGHHTRGRGTGRVRASETIHQKGPTPRESGERARACVWRATPAAE